MRTQKCTALTEFGNTCIDFHTDLSTQVYIYACRKTHTDTLQRSGGELPLGTRASTSRPKEQAKTAALGYGLEGETMYSTEYKRPQTSKGFVPNKIVTKTEIEGIGTHEVEPYGPLCKSLMQESFPAPPTESYLKKAPKPKARDPAAVGTVPPDRDVSTFSLCSSNWFIHAPT